MWIYWGNFNGDWNDSKLSSRLSLAVVLYFWNSYRLIFQSIIFYVQKCKLQRKFFLVDLWKACRQRNRLRKGAIVMVIRIARSLVQSAPSSLWVVLGLDALRCLSLLGEIETSSKSRWLCISSNNRILGTRNLLRWWGLIVQHISTPGTPSREG